MRRSIAGAIVAAAVAALAAGSPVAAQGRPGEMGGMGGGMGGRRMGGDPAQRFTRMASLDPVLKGITLDDAQKDSVKGIEHAYQPRFSELGKSMRDMFQSGERPDPGQMAQVRQSADSLRAEEWGAARQLLTADEQTTFDRNVAAVKAQEAQRMERMRARRGDMGNP